MPVNKKNKRKRTKRVVTERYSIKTLHEDREYGLFWYAWLWKVLRPILIFICSVLIVLGMVNYGYNRIYNNYFGPVDASNPDLVEFTINSGDSIAAIGNHLEEAKLVHSGTVFKYMVQLEGLTGNVSYGTYELSPSMTTSQVITVLTNGSQTNERTITIVPGWTCEDIADYLYENGAIDSVEEFLTLCNDTDRFVGVSYALRNAKDTGSLEGRKYALEGYLQPDTYRIFKSATAESIIIKLLTQNNTVIDDVYYADRRSYEVDAEGNYTEVESYEADLAMDQFIILASMIEKEAARAEDYPRVSAVFHNRLRAGMKLESDPTATYLSGVSRYVLTEAELTDNNTYNTYVVPALPAGPICNPSRAALEAAMNPDMDYINQNYLYFCATDPESDELAFAITEEEHRANVAMYQAKWEAYDAEHADR